MKEQKPILLWVPVVVMVGALAVWGLGEVLEPHSGSVPHPWALAGVPSFAARWLGYARIDDGVIAAPRNLPPIQNEFSYALVDIDGRRVKRAVMPPFTDSWPEALVRPGNHVFRVWASPAWRGPKATSHEEAFTAAVERGKRYFICSSDQGPRLIEARSR